MSYFVNWKFSVEQRLATIWVDAPDRAAVTAAAQLIDATLRRSPDAAGEQLDEERRILVERPLVVVYKVIPDDLRVDVLDVRRIA